LAGLTASFLTRPCENLLQVQPYDVVEGTIIHYINQRNSFPHSIYVKGNSDLELYEKQTEIEVISAPRIETSKSKVQMTEKQSDQTCKMLTEFTYQNFESEVSKKTDRLTDKDIKVLELDKAQNNLVVQKKHRYKPLSQ
jgi:hypothetical protein